jgi:hypothetical protein
VAEDHPVAIGEHDAVLGVLDELAQGLHLDAGDSEQHAEALASRLQIRLLDATWAFDLVRIERVSVEAAAPGGPDNLGYRKLRSVPADQIADEVRMSVGRGSRTHHN